MPEQQTGPGHIMHSLQVALAERSYSIHIDRALLSSDLVRRHIVANQVMVVTSETVAPLYLDLILEQLAGLQVDHLVLPDGEQFKNLEMLERIFDALLAAGHGRTTTLVALGGGVIGDMTGFAAACYQRGVEFIQVPTTLLAQVDSSVGGKTAVNHPRGKNMIGAFHQPRTVVIDTDVLATLPLREFSAGLAEVIKYGLIRDAEFLEWLEGNLSALLRREPQVLARAIRESCRNKAEVVTADETEQGNRALLNFGHTFGHAIETGTGYRDWLHGEAVGAGMVMAAEFSRELGWLPDREVQRLRSLVGAAGLPVEPPESVSATQFLQLMALDKKVLDGRVRLVLLRGTGDAVVTADFPPELLRQYLERVCGSR